MIRNENSWPKLTINYPLLLIRTYHLIPSQIRKLSWFKTTAKKSKRFVYNNLAGHDSIYDSDYFQGSVDVTAVASAHDISESISHDLKPKTVIDVGCGTGALLDSLRGKGCQVFGLEYSNAALELCIARELDVQKYDLRKDTLAEERTFDVAVSMEVAEHLPEKSADRFVDQLVQFSDVIVFSACTPTDGAGHGHINEQPQSYWISKFQFSGFDYDEDLSNQWRESWRAGGVVANWYHRNLMIFRRTAGL